MCIVFLIGRGFESLHLHNLLTLKLFMSERTFVFIWALGWLVTCAVSTFRAVRGRQAAPTPYQDVVTYVFAWWLFLPIFAVRWVKYRLRGQSI